MFKGLRGAWTNAGGTWTYSPYLPGNEDPNKPPGGATCVPGPKYSSPLCSNQLNTCLVDGQQIVDWSTCIGSSPYPSGGGSTGGGTTTTPTTCATAGHAPLVGQVCCAGLVKDAFGVCTAIVNQTPPGAETCKGTWVCSIPDMYLYAGLGIGILALLKR